MENSAISTSFITIGAGRAAVDQELEPESTDLNAYPNPTLGLFKITIPESEESTWIEIWSSDGKRVQETMEIGPGNREWALDITRQPAGLYLIRAITSQEIKTFRIKKD